MKKCIKELDIVDFEEMVQKIEQEALLVEMNLLKLYAEIPPEEQRIPVFDFEINWFLYNTYRDFTS